MKFTDLEPSFLQLIRTERPCNTWSFKVVETLAEADGVMFMCPTHFRKNGGREGTHQVICWFKNKNIPAQLNPGPGRWDAKGSLANLTLSPSVNIEGDWHGFIQNGQVSFV